jgi:hypothetical protein
MQYLHLIPILLGGLVTGLFVVYTVYHVWCRVVAPVLTFLSAFRRLRREERSYHGCIEAAGWYTRFCFGGGGARGREAFTQYQAALLTYPKGQVGRLAISSGVWASFAGFYSAWTLVGWSSRHAALGHRELSHFTAYMALGFATAALCALLAGLMRTKRVVSKQA